MNYAFAFFSLLVGFTPLVTMNAAHHMLTFACASPGSNKQVWLVEKCHLANKKKTFNSLRASGQACGSTEQLIIHGWARNAPSVSLPDGLFIFFCFLSCKISFFCCADVGFPVGRNTPYKYIVVNIHYLTTVVNDKSGNQLTMSRKPYVVWALKKM